MQLQAATNGHHHERSEREPVILSEARFVYPVILNEARFVCPVILNGAKRSEGS
jgi:hypothetical protein